MDELRVKSNGLEALFEYEKGKCRGILNGIDNEVWNPATDTYLTSKFTVKGVTVGKKKNKKKICEEYALDETLPLFVFIGRLVGEKAADILPWAFKNVLYHQHGKACYFVLGSGEKNIEAELFNITKDNKGYYNTYIGYDETLSFVDAQPCGTLWVEPNVRHALRNSACSAEYRRLARHGERYGRMGRFWHKVQ
jgi:starch synthase